MYYKRLLNPLGEDSLARLARRVPRDSRVLELGPATGYLSQYLSESLACTVDAIELSPEMAKHARRWCRRILVGDIELLDLSAMLDRRGYDVIVCGDVIEHLRDPWMLARRLGELLKEDGRLLLSVPNAGYLGLLVDLMRGRFAYRDEGLLDRSHLRFFTLDSLRDLLDGAGWYLWAAEQVNLALTDSEFHIRFETLSPALRDELMARPDVLCYQWVIEARKYPPATPFLLPVVSQEDRFQVRLFWQAGSEDFDYPRNQLVWACLGVQHQVLEFDIPVGQHGLALRLTDRIGFVRVHSINIFARDNIPLWHWNSQMPSFSQGETRGVEFGGSPGLWFIRDTESLLVLNLSPQMVAIGRRFQVELDAPVSSDFIDAKAFWESADGMQARLLACESSRRRLARRRHIDYDDNVINLIPNPVILHVLPACGGGIERFVRDLSNATVANWRHFALRVTAESWWLEEMATACHWPLSKIRQSEIVEVLAALCPVCIHLHGSDPVVGSAADEIRNHCSASLVATLHDVLFLDKTAFSDCHWNQISITPDQVMRKLLQTANVVTAPSQFIADLASKYLDIEVRTVANGIDLKYRPLWDDSIGVEIGGKYWLRRVAVLGALGRHKGGEYLFDIAAELPEDIVLINIGYLDGQLETGWACDHHSSLSSHQGAKRVFVTGPYAPSDLPALFEYYRPQLVLFPGIVPESFSYTLSEVWSLGAIPAVPLLGALGERSCQTSAVRFNVGTSPPILAELLDDWSSLSLVKRRNSLRHFIRLNLDQLVPTIFDMANTFNDLYKQLTNVSPAVYDANVLDRFSSLCEMNLDPAQFRTELRLMMEQNQALRATDLERQRWNERLENSISELKDRNLEVETQLASLAHMAERNRNQLMAQEREIYGYKQEICDLRFRLQSAHAAFGSNESDWISYGRVVRIAKRIPGLIRSLAYLASMRKR